MNKALLSLLAIIFCAAIACAQEKKYTLESADMAYMDYHVADSHKQYQAIAENTAYDSTTRAKAYVELATQDWKIYRDYTAAEKALFAARDLHADAFAVQKQASWIAVQAGDYKYGLLYAEGCLYIAKTDNEKAEAAIAFARAEHDVIYEKQVVDFPLKAYNRKQAVILLDRVLQKQPGNPDASELLLGIGLLLREGNTVLNAWRSYYLVDNEKNINQVLRKGYFKMKPVLLKWHGQQLSRVDLQTLAVGLADTKFFEYADAVIEEIKKRDLNAFKRSMELKDIDTYYTYIKGVQAINDKIYPQIALGLTHYEDRYDSLMAIPAKLAWNKFSFTDKHIKFDPDTFYNVMNRRFDMDGYTGTTVNYYGCLMGHIIHKELKQINQYGYSTKFTYISVDRLISRDFTSWYGTTNVGGWGDSTTIIQVRAAYMSEPFQALNWMTDSTARRNILDEIAKKKQADYTICKNDHYAEPKFLAPYLKFNEASKIYKRLTGSGLKGTALNIAFVDEIFRLTIASTIFAHEGRHAIDQLYFPKEFKTWSDDERELRAKYSEVIFSLDPKMAFTGSILGSGLDENTNHGKANARFRKLIADWMQSHRSEIKALDDKVPLLMQFDLLTDAQLITICKSGDPLAKMAKN